ncbi:MAG TPA: PAS domain-containing sensor histidine kinase [Armatimonadota bacterium]|jgi:PAS domain S-box-containing protein
MPSDRPPNPECSDLLTELRARLAEAEETLEALRRGAVDAVVVYGSPERAAPQIYTLESADRTYRVILEGMGEGAVTLSAAGDILFCNPRFAEMVQVPSLRVVGTQFAQWVVPEDREFLRALLQEALEEGVRDELTLGARDGSTVPVQVSISRVLDGLPLLCLVLTDLTERQHIEQELREHLAAREASETALLEQQERLRALTSQLIYTEERERRQLADLVHDDLGQCLALAKMRLQSLSAQLADGFAQELEATRALLDQSITRVRELTAELSPAALYQVGLASALEAVIDPLRRADLEITLEMDDGHKWPLSEHVRITLFRAVRELLVNALKYSRAQRVSVSVHRGDEGVLCVSVADDGVGFDPQALPAAGAVGGFGLFNIRERLTDLGGRFEIDSTPHQGARFTLTAPLAPAEEDRG